jgi:hypothetical protein
VTWKSLIFRSSRQEHAKGGVQQTRNHYSGQIASQVRQTSALSPYVCLYACRVRDAQQLESAIHKVLKVQKRHVADAEGIEWFEAPPEHVHELVLLVTRKKNA